MLTPRYDDALRLAHQWHRDQKRKGTDIPYLAHLLAVSALVLEHGGTEDEAIAGLLHDALEDALNQEEALDRKAEIRTRFGERALAVVEACTDAEPAGKGAERKLDEDGRHEAWMARKAAYVAHLGEVGGSVLLVAAADKLHNARAIVRDRAALGDAVFTRFVGRHDGTVWYYREVHAALEARAAEEPRIGALVRELGRVVAHMG